MMPWLVLTAFVMGIILGAIAVSLWFSHKKSVATKDPSLKPLGHALLAVVDKKNDEAMEHLVFLLNQTTDHIKAYMALSNLYRNKGWFHRSIDVRRRLLTRGTLEQSERREIMLGMVLDYQAAGLLGRATNAMKTIIAETEPTDEDFAMLAGLHEQSGRLQDAAETWKKIGNLENYAFVRAEIAREMIQNNDLDNARKYLGQTLKINRNNPAALLLLADTLARIGKIKQAERYFDILQSIRPDLTGVIADSLESIALDTSNEKTQAFFVDLLEKQKERPRVAVRYASYLVSLNRLDDARKIFEAINTTELAPEMMARLVDVAYRANDVEASARFASETIRRFLDNKAFVCHACKELVFVLEWKCPKCGRWGTIRSRRSYPVTSRGD